VLVSCHADLKNSLLCGHVFSFPVHYGAPSCQPTAMTTVQMFHASAAFYGMSPALSIRLVSLLLSSVGYTACFE